MSHEEVCTVLRVTYSLNHPQCCFQITEENVLREGAVANSNYLVLR